MLIVKRIKLSRIIRNTWQVDLIMIVSCTITYFTREYLISHHIVIPSIIPTVLGTAIAFFIGFNNNQAYDRWWEARKIWGGLVNDSRSFTRSLLSYTAQNKESSAIVRRMIFRHIAFLYALKANLRSTADLIYIKYLENEEKLQVEKQKNIHNAILHNQSRDLQQLYSTKQLDSFQYMDVNNMLVRFSDEMGMCERIKNTVFPTTYSYLTKVFIWLFVVTFTLVISHDMGYWSIFMGWLVGFVFVSTQINGMSLIDPFENNSSGVPLNQITRNIEINLLEMMGETDIPAPVLPINNEYVL